MLYNNSSNSCKKILIFFRRTRQSNYREDKFLKHSLTIKDIFIIFLRRKWAFIATMVIILIAGLLYTFIKIPIYESSSRLKLSGVYYNDDLLKYFPDESASIDVYLSNQKGDELEISKLNFLSKQIKDKSFLDEVAAQTGDGVTADSILSALVTLTDNNNRVLLIRISYYDPDVAYKINSTLINTFLDNYYNQKANAISELEAKINEKLNELNPTEAADKRIYEDLSSIKYNILDNKDYILNTVIISQEPSVPAEAVNINYLKEVPVILLISILAGLIVVFLPDVFLPLKKRNE